MSSLNPVSLTSFNHLIADYYSNPNKTPLEAFETNILHYEIDSIALSALEKICYVALIAIGATVFVSSFNLVALNITLWGMAKLLLTTPILAIASQKFAEWSQCRADLADEESKVKDRFERILDWKTPDIEAFLHRQQLKISNDSLNTLQFINPEEPLKPLLPLIARFHAVIGEWLKIGRRIGNLNSQLNEQEKQIKEKGESPDSVTEQQMLLNHDKLHKIIETESYPHVLMAATLLHIIENPTNRDLDVIPNSLLIPGLGECVPKSLDERYPENPEADKPEISDYFIFCDLQRKPLTTEDMPIELSQLRQMLFPRKA